MSSELSRRTLIRNVALGLTATGVLDQLGAQHVHTIAMQDRAATGGYQAKYFSAHEYLTISRLAELIVPADERSGSAVEAGAPEFIDLLCSQSEELSGIFSGGLAWLDAEMRQRFGAAFAAAGTADQTRMLDLLVEAERTERSRLERFTVGPQYQGFASYRAIAGSPGAPAYAEAGAAQAEMVVDVRVYGNHTTPLADILALRARSPGVPPTTHSSRTSVSGSSRAGALPRSTCASAASRPRPLAKSSSRSSSKSAWRRPRA